VVFLVDSEQADGAVLGIDFDVGSVWDAGGGSVCADHRRETEFARHDRGVAERSTFFSNEGTDHGQQRVHRRPVKGTTVLLGRRRVRRPRSRADLGLARSGS